MTMLTGKEAHRCSAWNNHWVIFPEHLTWPQHFSDHGYRTCLVGKMHFGGRDQMQGFQHRPYGDLRHGLSHQPDPIDLFPSYRGPLGAGVTEIPESLLQDVVVTRETAAFVLEHVDREPETPWFCCAGYSRPHSPFTAPGRYIRRYRDRVPTVELPDDFVSRLEPYAHDSFGGESGGHITPEQTARAREAYYACVDFVDDCIGELLSTLQKSGGLDNTIVIYTSDHGEMAGAHGLWGKDVYYDPSVCVPLLMAGPGISTENKRIADPISLMDLFPTTCALAGVPVPDGLDGMSFANVLFDPDCAASPRSWAPSAYYKWGVRVRGGAGASEEAPHSAMRLIRQRDWKYVDIEGGSPLLFDLVNDPDEDVNVADQPEHKERARAMRRILFERFSWESVHEQLKADRRRLPEFLSGQKPTTPNQYMLPDGRVFDAESSLYDARWLPLPPNEGGGIIPQQFG
jgi:choline-sulfatase